MTRAGLFAALLAAVVSSGCSALFPPKGARTGPPRRAPRGEDRAARVADSSVALASVSPSAPAPAASASTTQALRTPVRIGGPAAAPTGAARGVPSNDPRLNQELAFLQDDPNLPLESGLDAPGAARAPGALPRGPSPTALPARPVGGAPAGMPRPVELLPDTGRGRTAAPAGSTLHVVRRGETLWGISRTYGTNVAAIAQANGLHEASRLDVGQKLVIPSVAGGMRSLRRGEPAPEMEPAANVSGAGYVWPVQGKVTDHGTVGLEIETQDGAEVRATKGGVVAFASVRLQGFGQTLVLRHPGGVASFYAFCSELLVRPGETVRQGQAIARVGDTGRAVRPLLLFRLYRDGKPQSPLRLLP
ncbi:MAG: LysM peptidoglycan-binding domain-containing M23 family metallopeptidase [Planctomycetes bacterium]|nr:LysM peptidoglycan-binding domain-containing M23 family metallopeptidase [Planctomycetota bacterium]